MRKKEGPCEVIDFAAYKDTGQRRLIVPHPSQIADTEVSTTTPKMVEGALDPELPLAAKLVAFGYDKYSLNHTGNIVISTTKFIDTEHRGAEQVLHIFGQFIAGRFGKGNIDVYNYADQERRLNKPFLVHSFLLERSVDNTYVALISQYEYSPISITMLQGRYDFSKFALLQGFCNTMLGEANQPSPPAA